MSDTSCANITSVMLILYDHSFVTTVHPTLCLLLTSLLQVFWSTIFSSQGWVLQGNSSEYEKFSIVAQGSTLSNIGSIQVLSFFTSPPSSSSSSFLSLLFFSFFFFYFSFFFSFLNLFMFFFIIFFLFIIFL